MNNRQRITLACFLAYFVMSSMLAPIGIISTPLAGHYGLTVSAMTEQFSALTLGILVGAIAALFLPTQSAFRLVFAGLFIALSALLVTLASLPPLQLFTLALGGVGVGCGIGLAAAATTISRLYDGNQRASALVATDGCFSAAGVIVPFATTTMLSRDLSTGGVFALIACVCALIVVLAVSGRFPAAGRAPREPSAATRRKIWPATAWLGIAALSMYTLGQYAILFWLPAHLSETYSIPVTQGGALVSRFWTGMFIAQVVVAVLVLQAGTYRLLAIAAVATAVGSVPLWQTGNLAALQVLALLWGVANLGLLKLALTFVTLQFEAPTPRLVSCVLLGATLGTAISPLLTSRLVDFAGTASALQFGTGCHFVMAVLLWVALVRTTGETK
ncbi:MAG: MFS transporter [Pseudomonadota bacterium]